MVWTGPGDDYITLGVAANHQIIFYGEVPQLVIDDRSQNENRRF
jgi:hypothetical protein